MLGGGGRLPWQAAVSREQSLLVVMGTIELKLPERLLNALFRANRNIGMFASRINSFSLLELEMNELELDFKSYNVLLSVRNYSDLECDLHLPLAGQLNNAVVDVCLRDWRGMIKQWCITPEAGEEQHKVLIQVFWNASRELEGINAEESLEKTRIEDAIDHIEKVVEAPDTMKDISFGSDLDEEDLPF